MIRLILLSLVFLLFSCGNHSTSDVAPELEQQLAEKIALAEKWAARDKWGAAVKSLPSGKPDTGDALLWSGILCSANPVKFAANCEQVEDSQGPDGRIWRHPERVGKDQVNSFSRDMAMGLLLAVQRTGDVDMLQRWVDYVDENGSACDLADDNRCEMTTNIWSLAKIAAPQVNLGNKIILTPKQLLVVLYGAAVAGESGYPLHLIAQQLILLKRAGEGDAYLWKKTAEKLHQREPSNALFAHMAGETRLAMELMLWQIPLERPQGATQWSFEREDSDRAWERSMGWEFVWLWYMMKE